MMNPVFTPKEPTSPVTITFESWVGQSPQFKKFADEFHKLHPNITIEFQNVPAERATDKLTTQIAGGTAPDTAYVDSSAVETFSSKGALLNLDGYIAGSKNIDLEDYVPGFMSTAQYEGSTFGLPFDGETTGLFYRTDMFEAAGIEVVGVDRNVLTEGWSIHELGTARMGTDPKTSVLNQFQQSHDVKNLFVVDGSSHVSASCQNPTWTIMALAWRSCEYLADEFRKGNL